MPEIDLIFNNVNHDVTLRHTVMNLAQKFPPKNPIFLPNLPSHHRQYAPEPCPSPPSLPLDQDQIE